ncbi:DUF4245 domain-containing protein [Corynebacterium macclintockiae]|uniref:DUF4245 domain-containing protein n=1 Tax=Corynebacterium TaxID=1716 RepID=UPI0005578DCE|nr:MULTISPECIES: DUF4245 domain-containing protein [Corynebacterium]MDK8891325.1 DUF4245 domain-containing protein [Corynebacterium macclintockiae]OFM58166.1 hypothetical protein HMPREF2678_08405 [Corynebacterium sp. HMSC058E07]
MAGVQIQKPRAFQSTKDIVLSLVVLLFATFLTVGFTGLCSFKPGEADRSGPVQEVDADSVLQMDARSLSFPIRNPDMPDNWVANSVRRVSVGKEPSSLVGWVIDGENYISLTQTGADYKAATQPDDEVREETGTETTGDVEWHVFTGDDARPLWVADLGDVRLILEAMATPEQTRTAAERVAQTDPIDVGATASQAADGGVKK